MNPTPPLDDLIDAANLAEYATECVRAEAIAARSAGASYEAIGAAAGRSRETIRRWCNEEVST